MKKRTVQSHDPFTKKKKKKKERKHKEREKIGKEVH